MAYNELCFDLRGKQIKDRGIMEHFWTFGDYWAGFWHTLYFRNHKQWCWTIGQIPAWPGMLQNYLDTRYQNDLQSGFGWDCTGVWTHVWARHQGQPDGPGSSLHGVQFST